MPRIINSQVGSTKALLCESPMAARAAALLLRSIQDGRSRAQASKGSAQPGWHHPVSRTVGSAMRPEKTARESTVNQCERSAGRVIARSISGHLDPTNSRINSVPAWSHAICTASSFPFRMMKPFTKVSYSRLLGSHIPINRSYNPRGITTSFNTIFTPFRAGQAERREERSLSAYRR